MLAKTKVPVVIDGLYRSVGFVFEVEPHPNPGTFDYKSLLREREKSGTNLKAAWLEIIEAHDFTFP